MMESSSFDTMPPSKNEKYFPLIKVILENPAVLNKDLADRLGCSPATITRSIAELRELGWLQLKPDLEKILGLSEKIRISIKFATGGNSPEHGYQGRDSFAKFMKGCLDHPSFKPMVGLAHVETIETTNETTENVVVILWAANSQAWSEFVSQVASLPGVLDSSARQLFPVNTSAGTIN